MNEKWFSRRLWAFFVLLVICLYSLSAQAKYGGGTGEPNDPHLIYDANQMNAIGADANDWDKCFMLMADIDMSQYKYTKAVIAPDTDNSNSGFQGTPFTGVFDGNDHKLMNLAINGGGAGNDYLGLFGFIGEGGRVTNLGLEGSSVKGGVSVCIGGLCGQNYYGIISNCYAIGNVSGHGYLGGLCGRNDGGVVSNCYAIGSYATRSVEGGYWSRYLGGLCGYNYEGTISSCYADSSVVGWHGCYALGGLVGINRDGTISNCYATGRVNGGMCWGGMCPDPEAESLGGLVGGNGGTITNCYSTGSVEGVENVGGLVGFNYFGDSTISNCYSTGRVSGIRDVGGLCAENGGTISNCFWNTRTSGRYWSDGGMGLPTDQMQMKITFTDAGWDFVGETVNGIDDIWFIPHQDYPRLWWEGMQVPMKMTPVSLNCRSEGNRVKAHITLPEGFTVADVNSDRSAVLHSFGFQSVPPYVFVNKDKLVEIEAAFEREAVCSLAGDWPDELTVAGFLADGNIFLGTSTVRIIHPGMKVIEELASCWLQGDCIYPETDMYRDSLVNLLDYALLMNINIEFVSE